MPPLLVLRAQAAGFDPDLQPLLRHDAKVLGAVALLLDGGLLGGLALGLRGAVEELGVRLGILNSTPPRRRSRGR
jgi:hypothetical protein